VLIDIHVHCEYARRATRAMGKRLVTPDQLIGLMDSHGIDMVVVLPVASPECEYAPMDPEETLRMSEEYPGRIIPFFNLDARMMRNTPEADFRPIIREYKELGFKGVGEYMAVLAMDDPRNLNLFGQLEEIGGLPLLFHLGPRFRGCYGCYDELGLPRLERVLGMFPDLIFLAHSQTFWYEMTANVSDVFPRPMDYSKIVPGRVVDLFRGYPNLHGDLSAGSGYAAVSRDPEFGYAFMEEFQDRLYFGTDITYQRAEWNIQIVPFFRDLKENRRISPEAYEKIAWKNADRLLGLGLAEAGR
jgi:hypothetical protein